MARSGAGFGPVASISTGSPVAVTPITDQPASLAQCSAAACTALCRIVVFSIRSELVHNGTSTASSSKAIICTTNAIESINARLRRAVNARGHFPAGQAALK